MHWLLPFKGVREAKSRWPGLGSRREELVLRLLGENLATVAAVAGAENVYLVTPDSDAARAFPHCNCILTPGEGLNQDLTVARERFLDRDQPIGVLLPDLPTLGVEDVAEVATSVERSRVVLCPDIAEHGTNAVAMAPGVQLEFSFEGASFQRFLKVARDFDPAVLRLPGLARDCDDLSDLERYCLL